MPIRIGLLLAALVLCAVPAAAQQQIDPSVPTNIPPEDRDDFKGFLDTVLDDIIATNGPTVLNAGTTLWRGLATIVVVWTGIKIAMSGTFSMWAIIELVIGLWIPWAMLNFYASPLPPPANAFTFPGVIAAGGNWLMDFFLTDIVTAMKTEMAIMVDRHMTHMTDAWNGVGWTDVIVSGMGAFATLVVGSVMTLFVMLCLIVLYAITYAQVIWAQVAILILTFLGPMFIPWLVFEPMAFLFWGWFRSMITFALYGAVAGAVMRVFLSISLGYVTSFSENATLDSPGQMMGWVLIVLPLMTAGVISALKVGELAGMLVSGGGGGGAGMTGALMTAMSGGKAALAGKATGVK